MIGALRRELVAMKDLQASQKAAMQIGAKGVLRGLAVAASSMQDSFAFKLRSSLQKTNISLQKGYDMQTKALQEGYTSRLMESTQGLRGEAMQALEERLIKS